MRRPAGTPIMAAGPPPLPQLPGRQDRAPFGWGLSTEARRDIRRIEANAADALAKIGDLVLR